MEPSDEQRRALIAEVDQLFRTGGGTLVDFHQLRRYVQARPYTAPALPALLADEADERLRIADAILARQRRDTPGSNLPAILLALCATAPLHRLQWAEKEGIEHEGLYGVDEYLDAVTNVVRTYLQRPPLLADPEPPADAVPRSRVEPKICLDRDRNRCVLTGTPNPEVFHIVPFAANHTDYRIHSLRANMRALKTLLDNPSILTSHPGCTDKAWNMLSLAPSLHSWWARGHFALRCLGITPANGGQGTVDLQLHWQPKPLKDSSAEPRSLRPWMNAVPHDEHRAWIQAWQDRPCYGTFVDKSAADADVDVDAVLAVPHPVNSRLLQTGHVFSVTLPSMEDARNMQAMVDLQWACLRIASMSGAADNAFFLVDGDDHENGEAADGDA